ncbi:class I SAM-dependent methyltransferase [Kibdelosporangium philippinense]|uniref:Class I SAM-dependent methyltransferase n=1 Tax=Kibdelosporangium philippinense TaxID=211113 RepID=A0ABS8ZN86_9PSEU|nr:class I SAM-dependent methyltransferase [Kibdelosporangium philippinense]MCE7009226.1 class I SAM-dependent methyltransferase [Kibdelosporangium philippinense]
MTELPDAELRARRANSFGAQAAEYARYRPGYPAGAIDWVLPQGAADVLDLAAGTGKLTESLIGRGLNVTAVEPDPAMLGELRKRFPSVRALAGTAEQIPLPDSSVDAVLVGQAFHWFDPQRALTEIGRVLRQGGMLGALWNHEDEQVPWVSTFDKLARARAHRSWTRPAQFSDHPLFGRFEQQDFRHTVRHTVESLLAMIGTHSHMLVASSEERQELNERMRAYLLAQPETEPGEFDFPFQTTVYRGSRS